MISPDIISKWFSVCFWSQSIWCQWCIMAPWWHSDDIRWHPGHQYSDAKITQQGRGPGEECTNWLRIPGHCDKTSQSLPRFYIIWAGNQIPEISQTRAHLWEHLGHFWTARGDKILREGDFFPQPKYLLRYYYSLLFTRENMNLNCTHS